MMSRGYQSGLFHDKIRPMRFIASAFGVDQVFRGLWQGGKPVVGKGEFAYAEPFDTLVLCAKEIQHDGIEYPGLEVIRCPMDDNYEHMPVGDMQRAMATAPRVARRIKAGRRVLVTCHHGRNRSGLISAMAMVIAYGDQGVTPSVAIGAVRTARNHALTNPQFVEFLLRAER